MTAHMMTVSGTDYIPARLDGADIRIEDIAHALSLICRFGGHTKEHYSVAQHSLLVLRILASSDVSPEVQLAGLMHDAHEAYIGDIPTPIKATLGSAWKALEAQAASTVQDAFDLKQVMRQYKPIIKHADLVALATERRDLTRFDTNQNFAWDILVGVSPFHEPATTGSWSPQWWAELFFNEFKVLRDIVAIQPADIPTAM